MTSVRRSPGRFSTKGSRSARPSNGPPPASSGSLRFDVPLSTAQGFVTHARNDQQPGEPATETDGLRALADRAIKVIEAEMAKVEASSKRGSLDLPRIKRTLQAAQHLGRLEQILAAPTPRSIPTDQQASASARWLRAEMERDLKAQKTPTSEDVAPNQGEDLRARMEAELRAVMDQADAEAPHTNGHALQNAPDNTATPA